MRLLRFRWFGLPGFLRLRRFRFRLFLRFRFPVGFLRRGLFLLQGQLAIRLFLKGNSACLLQLVQILIGETERPALIGKTNLVDAELVQGFNGQAGNAERLPYPVQHLAGPGILDGTGEDADALGPAADAEGSHSLRKPDLLAVKGERHRVLRVYKGLPRRHTGGEGRYRRIGNLHSGLLAERQRTLAGPNGGRRARFTGDPVPHAENRILFHGIGHALPFQIHDAMEIRQEGCLRVRLVEPALDMTDTQDAGRNNGQDHGDHDEIRDRFLFHRHTSA